MAIERNGRRVSIVFTATLEDTRSDGDAIAHAAYSIENCVSLTDIRKLSIQVLGLVPNKKPVEPLIAAAPEPTEIPAPESGIEAADAGMPF